MHIKNVNVIAQILLVYPTPPMLQLYLDAAYSY